MSDGMFTLENEWEDEKPMPSVEEELRKPRAGDVIPEGFLPLEDSEVHDMVSESDRTASAILANGRAFYVVQLCRALVKDMAHLPIPTGELYYSFSLTVAKGKAVQLARLFGTHNSKLDENAWGRCISIDICGPFSTGESANPGAGEIIDVPWVRQRVLSDRRVLRRVLMTVSAVTFSKRNLYDKRGNVVQVQRAYPHIVYYGETYKRFQKSDTHMEVDMGREELPDEEGLDNMRDEELEFAKRFPGGVIPWEAIEAKAQANGINLGAFAQNFAKANKPSRTLQVPLGGGVHMSADSVAREREKFFSAPEELSRQQKRNVLRINKKLEARQKAVQKAHMEEERAAHESAFGGKVPFVEPQGPAFILDQNAADELKNAENPLYVSGMSRLQEAHDMAAKLDAYTYSPFPIPFKSQPPTYGAIRHEDDVMYDEMLKRRDEERALARQK